MEKSSNENKFDIYKRLELVGTTLSDAISTQIFSLFTIDFWFFIAMRMNELLNTWIIGSLLKLTITSMDIVYVNGSATKNSENERSSDVTQCPQEVNEDIQRCVQPVADYAKLLNNQQEGNSGQANDSGFGKALQLPKIGGKLFEELCRLIRRFERCVKDHRKKCNGHITISLIEASYGYLCNDGYDTFLNSAECLMELDQQTSVKQCHDSTLRNIEKANSQEQASVTKKLDDMCHALNSFSGCVMNPIRTICGADAWQVIFRVLRDTTRTLMPSCSFNSNGLEASEDSIVLRSRNRSQHMHHRHRSSSRTGTATLASLLPESADDFDKSERNERVHSDFAHQKHSKGLVYRKDSHKTSSAGTKEGNLQYIQVEVNEHRVPDSGDDEDLFRPTNHHRMFKNSAIVFTTFSRFTLAATIVISFWLYRN